jgi:hypothetical protein
MESSRSDWRSRSDLSIYLSIYLSIEKSDDNEDEVQTLSDICTRTRFFYLDLVDQPKGRNS